MRLFHALMSWQNVPHRWARWMILRVALRLARLDYLLFEVVQSLPMPTDLDRMRRFDVAESSSVRLASTLEEVQTDYLQPAIHVLSSVAQTTDSALRREVSGGRR